MVDAELIITLYDYLKDFVNSEFFAFRDDHSSPFRYLTAAEALVWLTKCPDETQKMNVAGCLSLEGRPDFKLLNSKLVDIPVNRYTALLKTKIELLSLLK